jgi:uncharacterized protein YegJ (DUF2314 family)
MVQVRCPECGYVQTLSEERFLTISEDFLNCPHCHARVPKQWQPAEGDSIPEEARHKMLAFSRRILNGGDVGREVVYALESLVRHHGPSEDANKALGIGYARLGENKKAEEFLLVAYEQSPDSPEVMRSLFQVLFHEEKYADAAGVGQSLVDMLGERAEHEDVARLALALLRLDKREQAQTLLEAFPLLDGRNSLVKQARRELHRSSGSGFGSFFGERGPLHRLLNARGKEGLISLTRRAKTLMNASSAIGQALRSRGDSHEESHQALRPAQTSAVRATFRPTMEYWIYAVDTNIPNWEQVRDNVATQYSQKIERERAFKFLESLIQKKQLTIEYLMKNDAAELFDYPEDLILTNSRDLTEHDRTTLERAQMIVRVRLSSDYRGGDGIVFVTRFVEAVRGLVNGVVQDADSHILWGQESWKASVEDCAKGPVASQVYFEVLDEGGLVWVHTHGMQKFGLPDLEMEEIPADFAAAARKLMLRMATTFAGEREGRLDFGAPISIPDLGFEFRVEVRPRDAENHFPFGSLKILPHRSGQDPADSRAAQDVLSALVSGAGSHALAGRSNEPPDQAHYTDDQTLELREEFLRAHRKAREELAAFKKSFQKNQDTEGPVHAVKVGFAATGDQYEWMWVSLDAWRGRSLVGWLENSPVLRKDLEKGKSVHVTEEQIFDWVIARDGEVLKGGYTESVVC